MCLCAYLIFWTLHNIRAGVNSSPSLSHLPADSIQACIYVHCIQYTRMGVFWSARLLIESLGVEVSQGQSFGARSVIHLRQGINTAMMSTMTCTVGWKIRRRGRVLASIHICPRLIWLGKQNYYHFINMESSSVGLFYCSSCIVRIFKHE